MKESEFDKMSMIIGYNQSDITYGQGSITSVLLSTNRKVSLDGITRPEVRTIISWSGGMSGFTLYYSHFTDIVDQDRDPRTKISGLKFSCPGIVPGILGPRRTQFSTFAWSYSNRVFSKR